MGTKEILTRVGSHTYTEQRLTSPFPPTATVFAEYGRELVAAGLELAGRFTFRPNSHRSRPEEPGSRGAEGDERSERALDAGDGRETRLGGALAGAS